MTKLFEKPASQNESDKLLKEAKKRDRKGLFKRGSGNAPDKQIVLSNFYLRGHPIRARGYATALAQNLALPEEMGEALKLAGLLYDAGNLGIEATVLQPGPLDDDQLTVIRNHVFSSYELALHTKALRNVPREIQNLVYEICLFHHERYDGTGYPYGLRGDSIPYAARIMSIADAFSAMVEERPHREPLSEPEAINEIRRGRGTQFDPDLADAFIRMVEGPFQVSTQVEERREAVATMQTTPHTDATAQPEAPKEAAAAHETSTEEKPSKKINILNSLRGLFNSVASSKKSDESEVIVMGSKENAKAAAKSEPQKTAGEQPAVVVMQNVVETTAPQEPVETITAPETTKAAAEAPATEVQNEPLATPTADPATPVAEQTAMPEEARPVADAQQVVSKPEGTEVRPKGMPMKIRFS